MGKSIGLRGRTCRLSLRGCVFLGYGDQDHSGGFHDGDRSYVCVCVAGGGGGGLGGEGGACIKLSEGRDIQSNSGLKVRPGRLPGEGAVLGERTKREKIVKLVESMFLE